MEDLFRYQDERVESVIVSGGLIGVECFISRTVKNREKQIHKAYRSIVIHKNSSYGCLPFQAELHLFR